MKKIMLILGLLLAQTEIYCQDVSADLTRELEKLSQENLIEGFGVAICSKDQVLYSQGFGYADREKKIPYTVETPQKIASISKTFLGVALMKAQSMGLLDLDDSANDYLPFPLIHPYFPQSNISIRHLATHSAGLKSNRFDREALIFPTPIPAIYKEMPIGIKRLLYKGVVKSFNRNEKMAMTDFLYEIYDPKGKWYTKGNFSKKAPGTQKLYSNNGAAFLAVILEKASGMSYPDFVRTHILSPLEMNATLFDFETRDADSPRESSLYHAGIQVPNDYYLITYPAGGLETNIQDFSQYMSAMMEGEENKILSSEAYREMMSPQVDQAFHQGILWEVYPNSIGHTGDLAGLTTHAYFSKETGLALVLFSNTTATKNIYKETGKILAVLKTYALKMN